MKGSRAGWTSVKAGSWVKGTLTLDYERREAGPWLPRDRSPWILRDAGRTVRRFRTLQDAIERCAIRSAS